MQHYELMYIVPIKVGQEDTSEIQTKVRTMLAAEGAKVTLEDGLGKRKLAYPINHIRHGAYVLMEFDLEPEHTAKVSDWFRLSPDVLRAQLVTKHLKTPEQLAREKALQEKLARKAAKAAEEAAEAGSPGPKPAAEAPKKVELAELDKKLEEILQQEIVK